MPRLVGRDVEIGRLEELLARARQGESDALALVGEAGAGKSSLLAHARAAARSHGMLLLGCRGVESEAQLSYAGLADVLRPVTHLVDQLPQGQAAELAAALMLGPPAAGNRFAVYLATLGMLSAVSDAGSVLVTVDDLQWLDPPSAEALLFAARRLQEEGVAVLMAVREGAPIEATGGLPVMAVGPLGASAAADLVRRSATSRVSDRVAEELVVLGEGNPLALVELTRTLTGDQLAGRRPLQPLPHGTVLDVVLRHRLSGLPAATALALLVVAVADETNTIPLMEALAALGLAADALDPAERAGVVTVDAASIRLRHPLLRAALTSVASGPDRRRCHAALAEVAARRGEPEREAWHRVGALAHPDESAASALAQVADQARARAGPAAAARALERASQITQRPERRVELLATACVEAMSAGAYAWSRDLVQRAAEGAGTRNPHLVVLRSAVEQACGAPQVAHALLSELGQQVVQVEPHQGAVLLAGAALAAVQLGDMHRAAAAAALTADVVAIPGSPVDVVCAATRAVVTSYAAAPGADMDAVLLVLDDEVRARLPRGPSILPFALQIAVARDQVEAARRVLERLVADTRSSSALGSLPIFLAQLADLHRLDGRWWEAEAEALEATQLARDTAQPTTAMFAMSVLAWLGAARGDAPSCLELLQQAEALFARAEPGCIRFPLGGARGLLHLSLGEPGLALLPLGRLLREEDRLGVREPAIFRWLPDLLEACVKAGRLDEAHAVLLRFDTGAPPSRWTRAVRARCRGLIAAGSDVEGHFREALTEHGDRDPFDRARTELCLGDRLRRSRRRAAALPWLDSAADTFVRLGARAWADRAQSELAVAGAGRRSPSPVAEQQLTPRELQIAMMVAAGASNREIAASLFLSAKTVEAHLTRMYRSQGVSSRAQLGARLRDGALLAATP